MAEVIVEAPMAWDNTLLDVSKSLVFSVSEFKEQFLWGLPLCNPTTGQALSDDVIKFKLLAAQKFLEHTLGIKLFKQTIVERKDYVREEWYQWGFVKTSYPILQPVSLTGNLNGQTQLTYPPQWLSTKQSNDEYKNSNLYVVPNGVGNTTVEFLAVNYSSFFSFYGARIIPNYWEITYKTGFDNIPYDLISIVGKIAAVELLPIIEMSIGGMGGAMFGMASQSISLDGLSQSVSKANGGNLFQNRLKQYGEELLRDLPKLKMAYVGIVFDVM